MTITLSGPDGPFVLTITKAGNGTVTSSPVGIDCGTDCAEAYAIGTVVTLTATPDSSSVFGGWGGDTDCADGSVTMNSNKTCTAAFYLPGAPAFAYISNFLSDTVSVINTLTNTVTATVPVGSSPFGVAVSPDGTRVYVATNSESDTVSVIDAATNTVTTTILVGDNPYAYGQFIGPAPPLEVDLTGEFTRLSRRSSGSLDLIGFVLAVQNNGNAATEGAFGVDLYLLADTIFDSSDLFLTSLSVSDSLGSGEEVELSRRLSVSGPTSGQFVLAVVDANGEIGETDEGNNVVAGKIP